MGTIFRSPSTSAKDSTLYLSQVPSYKNTIDNLSSHFSQFGKVLTIGVSYKGDPCAAAVTFKNHEMASSAFDCPKFILNTRSIKKSWHPQQYYSALESSLAISTGQQNHPEPILFECEKCGKLLLTQQSRQTHMKTQHTTFKCEVCHQEFGKLALYARHINADKGPVQCKLRYKHRVQCETSKNPSSSTSTAINVRQAMAAESTSRGVRSEHGQTNILALERENSALKSTFYCTFCFKDFRMHIMVHFIFSERNVILKKKITKLGEGNSKLEQECDDAMENLFQFYELWKGLF